MNYVASSIAIKKTIERKNKWAVRLLAGLGCAWYVSLIHSIVQCVGV